MSLIFTDTLQTYDSTGLYTLQAFVNGEWLDLHTITGVTTGSVEVDALVNTIDVDTTLLIPGWSYDFRWVDSLGNASNITNLPIPSDSSGSGSGSSSGSGIGNAYITLDALDPTPGSPAYLQADVSLYGISNSDLLCYQISADGNSWFTANAITTVVTAPVMILDSLPLNGITDNFPGQTDVYIRVLDLTNSIYSNALIYSVPTSGSAGSGTSITITSYNFSGSTLELFFNYYDLTPGDSLQVQESSDGNTWTPTTAGYPVGSIVETGTNLTFSIALLTLPSPYLRLVDLNNGSKISNTIQAV